LRNFFCGKLHWVALGAGIVLLVGGISVSLWVSQRYDGPGPALGPDEGAPTALETGEDEGPLLLPTRNTTVDRVSAGASPTVSVGGSTGLPAEDTMDTRRSAEPQAKERVEAGPASVGGSTGLPAKDIMDTRRSADADAVESTDAAETGPGVSEMTAAADRANVSDSAELEVQRGGAPQPRGSSADGASVRDRADLVVRDASGNIKQRETVR
jgi:hypothetical protein